MKYVIAVLLLALVSCKAHSCDWQAGPGAAVRLSESKSGGVAAVECVLNDRWKVSALWFGEQRIYDDTVLIEPYPAIGGARLWTWREGKNIRPYLGAGLIIKEAERCHFNGDLECNRLVPLPFCFWALAGVHLWDVTLSFNHCSNASLDYGPEKKNLGQDFILFNYRF